MSDVVLWNDDKVVLLICIIYKYIDTSWNVYINNIQNIIYIIYITQIYNIYIFLIYWHSK